jgi:HK97 gp10 family phage protein
MAGRRDLHLYLAGANELIQALQEASKKINPALRRVARAATTPVLQSARQLVPASRKKVLYQGKKVFRYGTTGQLKKSLGYRVTTSKKTGAVHAVVGPRRGFKIMAFKAYHKPKRGVDAQRNVLVPVNPTYYSHLIEKGFTAKLWRSGKLRPVPAKPFLGPALNANKDQIEEITARILTDEIIKTMPRKAAFS